MQPGLDDITSHPLLFPTSALFNMKFTLFIISALLSAATATALPGSGPDLEARKPQCDSKSRSKSVKFYQAVNDDDFDHFYTTDKKELADILKKGFNDEGSIGRIFKSQEKGSVELFRLYNKEETDHALASSKQDRKDLEKKGYKNQKTAGYVYPKLLCGSVPLFELFNEDKTDHVYTTDEDERDELVDDGYDDLGPVGFIYPK